MAEFTMAKWLTKMIKMTEYCKKMADLSTAAKIAKYCVAKWLT
jgi:hypothetical protein